MRQLDIEGAWLYTPRIFEDDRGRFLEFFSARAQATATGSAPVVAQGNCIVSATGAIRGIHFTDVPPGQAKHVTCVRGTVLDVVVDVRVGSPTFGRWQAIELDDRENRAVYLAEGLGHAVMAVGGEATVVYLCSTPYAPGHDRTVHPLDPAIGIAWPAGVRPILSPRDGDAPTLAEAARQGLLPRYDRCPRPSFESHRITI